MKKEVKKYRQDFYRSPYHGIDYCAARDVAPVQPFGYVNLCQALANGSVPSDISDVEENYNGIDDPASILGKPSDVFDAAHMRESISSYKKPDGNVE